MEAPAARVLGAGAPACCRERSGMKIIVIGATGTVGSEVVKALSLNKHEIVRASRSGDVKVNLDDAASIRAMFEKVATSTR